MTAAHYHRTDTPGVQLQKLAQQIYDADVRGRGLDWAMTRAREQRPDLVALHHAGLAEDPGPLVDPGLVLAESREAYMQKGYPRETAWSLACKDHPEAFTAWSECRLLPADKAPSQYEAPAPARRSSDASVELMRLTQETMAADRSLTVSAARDQVLARDPTLARHYHEGRPLPMAAERPRSDRLIEAALVEAQATRAEIEKLKRMVAPPAQRKFMELSVPEKQAWLRGCRGQSASPTFSRAERAAFERGAATQVRRPAA